MYKVVRNRVWGMCEVGYVLVTGGHVWGYKRFHLCVRPKCLHFREIRLILGFTEGVAGYQCMRSIMLKVFSHLHVLRPQAQKVNDKLYKLAVQI